MKIDRELIEDAISTFGVDGQIDHMIEEAGELIVALMEMKRNKGMKKGRVDSVITEIADVLIMAEQMAVIFGEGATQTFIDSKQEYLRTLIDERNEHNHG